MPLTNPTYFPLRSFNISPRAVDTTHTVTTTNLPAGFQYVLESFAFNYITGAIGGNRALVIIISNPASPAFPVLSLTYPVGGITLAGTVYQLSVPAGLILSGGLTAGYNQGATVIAANYTIGIFDFAAIDPTDAWLAGVTTTRR